MSTVTRDMTMAVDWVNQFLLNNDFSIAGGTIDYWSINTSDCTAYCSPPYNVEEGPTEGAPHPPWQISNGAGGLYGGDGASGIGQWLLIFNGGNSVLSQNITTTPGQTMTLSRWLYVYSGSGTSGVDWFIQWNGSTVITGNVSIVNTWTQYATTVTATGNDTFSVTFQNQALYTGMGNFSALGTFPQAGSVIFDQKMLLEYRGYTSTDRNIPTDFSGSLLTANTASSVESNLTVASNDPPLVDIGGIFYADQNIPIEFQQNAGTVIADAPIIIEFVGWAIQNRNIPIESESISLNVYESTTVKETFLKTSPLVEESTISEEVLLTLKPPVYQSSIVMEVLRKGHTAVPFVNESLIVKEVLHSLIFFVAPVQSIPIEFQQNLGTIMSDQSIPIEFETFPRRRGNIFVST